MVLSRFSVAFCGLALLAACEARIGKDGDSTPQAKRQSADAGAKAEEGQLSIDAPGFEMKLDIPASLAERADIDSDSGILYPGAALNGIHVEARDRAGPGKSMVELRFISTDMPAKVAAWYRDPARAKDFAIGSASESAGVFTIAGTAKEDGDPFELRLSARGGGGTDGRLSLRDSG